MTGFPYPARNCADVFENQALAKVSIQANAVYRALKRAAAAGEPCPTNWDIVEITGAKSGSYVSRIVEQLAQAGLIVAERGQCQRVITIVATGDRTAGTITAPHWRDREQRPAGIVARKKHNQAPEPERPRVDRDPCPRCGVRADIGCGHRATRLVTREAAPMLSFCFGGDARRMAG